jgi:hypothetical protein
VVLAYEWRSVVYNIGKEQGQNRGPTVPGSDAIFVASCLATAALLLPATQPSPVANTEKLPKTIVHPAN